MTAIPSARRWIQRSRFARRRRWPWWVALLALVALIRFLQKPADPPTEQAGPTTEFAVAAVIDGDTLLLKDRTRVRLIGVDTPETVRPEHPVEPFGPEASRFTSDFIGERPVRLEFDRERRDAYDRVLAYVWVDGKLLNEELLRAGLARATLRYNFSSAMKNRFRQAEQAARVAHRGLWSP